MKKLLVGVGIVSALLFNPVQTKAVDELDVTNNAVVEFFFDSFGFSQYANCYCEIIFSTLASYHRTNFMSFREHSQAGQNNYGFLTLNQPRYGIPDFYALRGTTNAIGFIITSDNGGSDPNLMTNLTWSLRYPTNLMTPAAVITNNTVDFPNAGYLVKWVTVGDPPYYSAAMNSTYNYSGPGLAIATNYGQVTVNSWLLMTNIVATYKGGYPGNASIFQPTGVGDHHAKSYDLCWADLTLINKGVDTNTWTAIVDYATGATVSAQHCVIGSITKTATSISFPLIRDRQASGFYVPDSSPGGTTNDCREAFSMSPALGNAFCEIIKVPNLPAGTYDVTYRGEYWFTASSTALANGVNTYTNYNGPVWRNKLAILYALNDMRGVSRVDQATLSNLGTMLDGYESNARSIWPSSTGIASYATNATMVTFENQMFAQDIVINALLQDSATTGTVTISQQSFTPAPFR